jgi:hypothetical protein
MSKRNRNKQRQQQQNSNQGLTHLAPSKQPSKGAIGLVGELIYGASSHKGAFWLGVGFAAFFGFQNCRFYFDLLQRPFGVIGIGALIGGIGITLATTYFEVAPVIRRKSARSAFESIFRIAAKPQQLPHITKEQYHNPQEAYDNYRLTEKRYEDGATTMRWIVIAVEIFLGLVFLGSIGTGMKALGSLVLFVMSIFGTEHGLVMAIRAYDMVLPPAIRQQMDKLLRNGNQPLKLP